MSYSICRIAKVKASGVTGIQIHDRREKESVSHTNKDIDWNKTHENVDLLEQRERFRTVISGRIAELNLPRAIRKDATVMTQCLVTSDSAFFDKMPREEQTEYFRKSLDFIEKRYGKENMVSATVHYDEQTPHMHVNFVPVTADGRLSARDLFSPAKLRKLQDDYNRTCRENGYDVERGELHSKREHLSVEEYKVSTRYDELKVKQTELERLEGIDKEASLRAEKGKLTYSTKEVEAIKDQNRSLKVDGYNKDSRISELKDKVSRVRNSLLEARSDLKGVKAPLERLKDLESENKALQAYSEKHPAMQKDMQTFHGLKDKAYQFGDRLVERKTQYQQIIKRHHKSIEETKALEIRVQEHNGSVSDLRQRQGNFNTSSERLEGLEGQLESTKGVFKILQRKEIQADIDKEKVILQELSDNLKTDYSIEADAIPSRVESLLDKKTELVKEKQTQIEYTNKCEQVKGVVIQEYKYTEALSDTQDKDFREISARHDALEKLPDHNDERHFRTSRDDRAWIVDRMQEQHPQNVERCQYNFAQKDQIDREKMAKQATKNIDMDLEL
ncbi:MAG TPA: MobV family relaxase [Desulfosporosinus sp.]